jgi:hypothetical protein
MAEKESIAASAAVSSLFISFSYLGEVRWRSHGLKT